MIPCFVGGLKLTAYVYLAFFISKFLLLCLISVENFALVSYFPTGRLEEESPADIHFRPTTTLTTVWELHHIDNYQVA